MRKFYFFLLAAFVFQNSKAQIIDFPDPIFKAKLLASDVTNDIARKKVWPPVDGQTLVNIKIDANDDGEITVAEASLVRALKVQNSGIHSVQGFELFLDLESLRCENNQIASIDLGDVGAQQNSQFYLYCENNVLTAVEFGNLTRPLFLYADNNLLTGFDFSGMEYALQIECSNNPISTINTGNYNQLIYLECNNTPVTSIDISGNSGCEIFYARNSPNLTTLILKDAVDVDPDMGDMWDAFYFDNNPNLQYVCVSENRLVMAQNSLNGWGYTNVVLNSYCDFNPGAVFYTVQGTNKLDGNSNGCDSSDGSYPNLRYNITNSVVSGTIVSNTSGNFSIPVLAGSHSITPIIENPSFYNVSPSSLTVNFPAQPSVNQDFCITPNGIHNDLEVVVIPMDDARPGFNAVYKILCRNKGTVTQSANVSLAFDDLLTDYVSSVPTVSAQSTGNLNWQLTDIHPFETKQIVLTVNVNSPIETPPVNSGDVLSYAANIAAGMDETPNDNTFVLNQTVVNSFDPNDKICLEGNTILPEMAGEYVHYQIRFENTGTFFAENIVVKDIIDTTKFDINSLVVLDGSHDFYTRINGNKVEFIFENIDLAFWPEANNGYVLFKIKTLPTLVLGDTFSNTASIYFDYNHPIVTEPAVTTLSLLNTQDFAFDDYFSVYPNPAGETLQIKSKSGIEISAVSIYNTLGQLVLAVPNARKLQSIDVSDLQTGNYFIKIVSDRGTSNARFIKL